MVQCTMTKFNFFMWSEVSDLEYMVLYAKIITMYLSGYSYNTHMYLYTHPHPVA